MSRLSDHAENLVANWLMTDEAVTRPTGWHLALFTSAPNDAGGGIEVTGGGYSRAAVTMGAALSAGSTSNAAPVVFQAAGDWGTITHAAIFDAATAGNMLWHGQMIEPKGILNGDSLTFAAGALILSISGALSNYGKKAVMDWLMTTATVARPAAWYQALFTGPGSELSGSGYFRAAVDFAAATGGVVSNAGSQVFSATDNWGVVSHSGIYDAASGGNLLAIAAMTGGRPIGNGDSVVFPVGSVNLAMS